MLTPACMLLAILLLFLTKLSCQHQALPDLLKLWSKHGFGLVAKHKELQWSGSGGGALTATTSTIDFLCESSSFMQFIRLAR